jgi:hypothetical protein
MDTKMIVQRVKPMRQTVRLLLLLAAIDCTGAATAWELDKIRIGMGKSGVRLFNLNNLPAAFSPSTPQLLARDRRAVAQGAQLGPGDLRMDAAA